MMSYRDREHDELIAHVTALAALVEKIALRLVALENKVNNVVPDFDGSDIGC
jgi:hypothetical protein